MPGLDPATEAPIESHEEHHEPLTKLPFPPITKQHILNCSYHSWYPKYKSYTLKSRLIPLTPAFLDYLREDGLWLPDDEDREYEETEWSAENANKPIDPDFDTKAAPNSAAKFQDVHDEIKKAIQELGGVVVPKLNWSAPKDATHMALSKNDIACRSPSDIYLLLKSSIFVTHDLEHAFDDTADNGTIPSIPYYLILRPYFKINPTFEFRCFVRERRLVGISQRELKHVDYGDELLHRMQDAIEDFFEERLRDTFEDESFAFDVYVPEPHNRVRLIDVNPWAPRTDPLLFSWLELLTKPLPAQEEGEQTLRLYTSEEAAKIAGAGKEEDTEEEDSDVEEIPQQVEFRTVKKNDPEAYGFASAPYSAHKLPKELVMEQWEKLGRGELDEEDSSDEEEEEVQEFGDWDDRK
jgi:hypothetical protein